MTCPHRHSDGAYVLGALCPAERTTYESHLATCADCTAAVARLAPVPGLLGRVDPAMLRRPDPEPTPGATGPGRLTQLLQTVTQERRRQVRTRRWQLAAAVLGSVLLAVAGTAAWLGPGRDGSPAEPPAGEQMQPVAADVSVVAEVGLAEGPAGTEVWLRCAYPDPDADGPARVFRLVAVGTDGSREQVGSWLAAPGDEVAMTGVTRFTGGELARLELRGYGDRKLLSYVPG